MFYNNPKKTRACTCDAWAVPYSAARGAPMADVCVLCRKVWYLEDAPRSAPLQAVLIAPPPRHPGARPIAPLAPARRRPITVRPRARGVITDRAAFLASPAFDAGPAPARAPRPAAPPRPATVRIVRPARPAAPPPPSAAALYIRALTAPARATIRALAWLAERIS